MPLPTVHYALARTALERWRLKPALAPFDPEAAGATNAYYHGSLGPDMGLFPGGVPRIAKLAHTVRTGELARTLVASAETDVERAFAWGWLTHVLADAAIHPLINAHARRLLESSGDGARDAEAMAAAHSRVELGLDVYCNTRDPHARRVRLRPCFRGADADFLAAAFLRVHGVAIPREQFLRSHRAVNAMANALMRLERLHAHAAPSRRVRPLRPVLRAVRRGLTPRLSRLNAAFLHPLPPHRSLVRLLDEVSHGFWIAMRRHQLDDLAHLGNPDLEGLREPVRLTA